MVLRKSLLGIIIVFVAFLLLIIVFPSQAESPYYRQKWALLIGVNQYPESKVNALNYAVNDALAIRELLVHELNFPEKNLVVLTDRQATKKGIEDQLNRLTDTNRVKKDDQILVFFSGHGQTVPTNSGEMGFLVPYDARINMSDTSNPSQYLSSCISMDKLKEISNMTPAKHVLFLVDACYSGLAAQKRDIKSSSMPIEKLASLPVKQIITAGLKDEESVEDKKWRHGAFTFKLLEAIKKRAADNDNDYITTGTELGTYLRSYVPKIAPGQTPFQTSFDGGAGDFLFEHIDPVKADKEAPRIFLARQDGRSVARGLRAKVDTEIKLEDTSARMIGLVIDNLKVATIVVDNQTIKFSPAPPTDLALFEGVSSKAKDDFARFTIDAVVTDMPRIIRIRAKDTAGNQKEHYLRLIPPGKGSLRVKTIPMGARITIDDKFYSYTPKVIPNIPAGERQVELVLGDQVYKTKVVILPNQVGKLKYSWDTN